MSTEKAPAPKHVGVVMDGNGRWAKARGRSRTYGHRRGVDALRASLSAARELGVEIMTLYSFSTENWRRPQSEVVDLMRLLKQFVDSDIDRLAREGVRVRVIGDRDTLREDLRAIVERAEETTRANHAFTLVIAFNYGGRDEIARAARRLAEEAVRGLIEPASIDPAALSARLDTADLPDPDLIIRTGGEKRLSNFLIWQAAYSEFVFLDVMWPDFGRAQLEAAFDEYRRRERRFGDVTAQA